MHDIAQLTATITTDHKLKFSIQLHSLLPHLDSLNTIFDNKVK